MVGFKCISEILLLAKVEEAFDFTEGWLEEEKKGGMNASPKQESHVDCLKGALEDRKHTWELVSLENI